MNKIFSHVGKKTKIVFLSALTVIVAISLMRIAFDIRRGPPKEWMNKTFAGKIISKEGNVLTLRDAKGAEKIFTLATSSQIFSGRANISPDTLSPGSFIVVESDMDLKIPSEIYSVKNIRLLELKP